MQVKKSKKVTPKDDYLAIIGVFTKEIARKIQTIRLDYSQPDEEKSLTVGDVGVNYRNLNYLEEAGLLPFIDSSKKALWRRFDKKDTTYIRLLWQFKELGIRNESLKPIKKLFYNERRSIDRYLECSKNTKLYLALNPKEKSCFLGTDKEVLSVIGAANYGIVVVPFIVCEQ